jgi:hypothetical protein
MTNRTIFTLFAALSLASACKQAPSEQERGDDQFKPAGLIQPTAVAEEPPAPASSIHADYKLLAQPGVIAARCGHDQDKALIASIERARTSYVSEDYAKSLLTTKTSIQSCPDGELIGHLASCYEQLGIQDKATRYQAAWAREQAGEGPAIDMLPELQGVDADAIQNAKVTAKNEDDPSRILREAQKMGIHLEGANAQMPLSPEQQRRLLLQRTQPQQVDIAAIQRNLSRNGSIDPKVLRKMQKMQKKQQKQENP